MKTYVHLGNVIYVIVSREKIVTVRNRGTGIVVRTPYGVPALFQDPPQPIPSKYKHSALLVIIKAVLYYIVIVRKHLLSSIYKYLLYSCY